MTAADGLWRVVLSAPAGLADAIAAALEPLSIAVTVHGDGDAGCRVEGLCRGMPDRGRVEVAVALASAALGAAAPPATVEPLARRDWLAENRETFRPFTVGRFFVHGDGFAGPVPAGRIGLGIDAGAAFGTGRHATTAGCLAALDGLANRRVRRALDFGAGSGVLAIAMARLFRAAVAACDIDPRAVAVARHNAKANGVGPRVRTHLAESYASPAVTRPGPYDLVTSNILARPLIGLAAGLGRVTAPGGVAVLSGFLVRDAGRVLAAHAAHGFHLARRIDIDGWRTLVLRKH